MDYCQHWSLQYQSNTRGLLIKPPTSFTMINPATSHSTLSNKPNTSATLWHDGLTSQIMATVSVCAAVAVLSDTQARSAIGHPNVKSKHASHTSITERSATQIPQLYHHHQPNQILGSPKQLQTDKPRTSTYIIHHHQFELHHQLQLYH